LCSYGIPDKTIYCRKSEQCASVLFYPRTGQGNDYTMSKNNSVSAD